MHPFKNHHKSSISHLWLFSLMGEYFSLIPICTHLDYVLLLFMHKCQLNKIFSNDEF